MKIYYPLQGSNPGPAEPEAYRIEISSITDIEPMSYLTFVQCLNVSEPINTAVERVFQL